MNVGITKVAVIEPVGGHGGMNFYDFGLLDGLQVAGVSTAFYTCDETHINPLFANCTYCYFKNIYGKSPKPVRFVRYVWGLVKSLIHAKGLGVKIVHFHIFDYSLLEVLCVVLSCLLNMRIALTVHDVENFHSKRCRLSTQFIFRKSHGIIVHNSISFQAVLKLVPDVLNKISIIPHGNYLEYVKDAPSFEIARKNLGIPLDAQVALFFGQIKKVKGLDVLLHAWKGVAHDNAKSLLIVAGKIWKDDFEYYRGIVEQYHLESSVRFDIRYIPDDEALMYYAAADLIVLPYRKIYQSGVLLMAMSHAKSVLVSDLPGMLEIVKNEENGFVFRSEDVLDLSLAINRILTNVCLRSAVASNGLKTMATHHDWHRIGVLTKVFYDEIS